MKRRLPTTYQGETVLAAISRPPVTAEANRHAPTRRHPGSPAAAANAAPTAASANRARPGRRRDRRTAQLHRQRRERHPQLPAAGPEPADPAAGGLIRHPRPFRRRADPAPAAGHLGEHRADGLGHIQPPGQRERRQQRVAHPARRAPQPGHEDLPAPARLPDITPVPRPEHQRRGTRRAARARETHVTPGRHVRIDRKRARPIRWPQATPPRIPSRGRRNTKARRGSLTFNGDTTILTRPQAGRKGDIAEEHGRAPSRDAQIVRPSTPAQRSGHLAGPLRPAGHRRRHVRRVRPQSPDSHRVVRGLTSRPPVSPGGLSSGFPFARRVPPLRPPSSGFPSSGVLRFVPFGRCPVPVPLRFPSGSPFP